MWSWYFKFFGDHVTTGGWTSAVHGKKIKFWGSEAGTKEIGRKKRKDRKEKDSFCVLSVLWQQEITGKILSRMQELSLWWCRFHGCTSIRVIFAIRGKNIRADAGPVARRSGEMR
jgi:hypothetical protein